MKSVYFTLLSLSVIILSNVSISSNTTYITKGRCQYVVYNESIAHAGDCRYHLDIEEKKQREVLDELREINKELIKLNKNK